MLVLFYMEAMHVPKLPGILSNSSLYLMYCIYATEKGHKKKPEERPESLTCL